MKTANVQIFIILKIRSNLIFILPLNILCTFYAYLVFNTSLQRYNENHVFY